MLTFIKNFFEYKKYQYRNLIRHHNFYIKNSSNAKIINKLRSQGYFVIQNFMNTKDCKFLINEIQKFIDLKNNLIWQDSKRSDQRIHGFENVSNIVNLKLKKFNEFTRLIAREYLKQDVGLYMTMGNKVTFYPSNLGSGQGWHKDSYSKQFKSILYLNDVNKNNGPFQIIKKSNSNLFMFSLFYKLKNKYPSTRFSDDEIKKILNKKLDKITELTGKTGTLIMADTSLLHRGKPLNSDERYALTNYFFPKKDFPNHEGHFVPKVNSLNI